MALEKTVNLDTLVKNRGLDTNDRQDVGILDTPEAGDTGLGNGDQNDEGQDGQQFEENNKEGQDNQDSQQNKGEQDGQQQTIESESDGDDDDYYNEIPVHQEQPQEQPEEFDLTELTIDQDGVEIPVSSIIEERNDLLARVQEIENDPFLKGFVEYYRSGGDVTKYIEAKGQNWDGFGDLEVLRRTFYRENSDLNPAVREKLFKKEIERKYGFDPESVTEEESATDDFKIAQELIKRDAMRGREAFKSEQQKFTVPKKEQIDPQVQRQEVQRKVMEQKEVRNFLNNKLVRVDVPDDNGNYFAYVAENPQEVVEMIIDGNKFWQTLTVDGKVDWNKANKVLSYAMNPAAFEKELIQLGRRQGRRDKIMQDRNIDGRLNQEHHVPANNEKSEKEQILGAFLQKKRSHK